MRSQVIRRGLSFMVTALCLAAVQLSGNVSHAGTVPMTIEECLSYARANSPEKKRLLAELNSAELAYRAQKTSFMLPQASLSLSSPDYSRFRDVVDNPPFPRILYESRTFQYSGGLSLTQKLITGGSLTIFGDYRSYNKRDFTNRTEYEEVQTGISARLTQPLLDFSAGFDELNEKRRDLELARIECHEGLTAFEEQVATGYLDLVTGKLTLKADSLDYRRSKKLNEEYRTKWQQGLISAEDYFEKQDEYTNAEVQMLENRNNHQQAVIEFSNLIGLDPDDRIEVLEPRDWPALIEMFEFSAEPTIGSSAEVTKARIELDRKQKAVEDAGRSGRISGELALNYSFFGRGPKTRSSLENMEPNRWGAGLSFNIPIWDGGATSGQVAAAEASYTGQKIELEKRKKLFALEFDRIRSQAAQKKAMIDIYSEKLQFAVQDRINSERLYREGLLSEADLLLAESRTIRARISLLNALKDYISANLDMKKLLVPTDSLATGD